MYVSYSGGSALPEAVQWVEAVLLGSVGTTLAVIGVGLLGMGMLLGRLSLRTAGRVILGIFILFGASTLARELLDTTRATSEPQFAAAAPAPPPPPKMPAPTPADHDPYAGAAVPM